MTLLDTSFTHSADPADLAALADIVDTGSGVGTDVGSDVGSDVGAAADLAALAEPAAVEVLDDSVLPSELVLGSPGASPVAVESSAEIDDEGDTVGSSYARCADGNGTLTHLFFSDDEFDIARAKAICSKCSLAPTCLSDALDRAEPYGVWGGQLLVEGVVVAVKRGRGRPPKVPRPVLVVDEVPVPPHLVA